MVTKVDDVKSISRRGALQLAAGAGVAVASLYNSSMAQALKRFSIGASEIVIISDGNLVLPASFVFPEVADAERAGALAESGLPTDTVKPDCNVVLLRLGERSVLFDVGSGGNFMPTAGKLLENLGEAGVSPDSITDVVFTHAHPDHLWGLTDEFDELVFANATYRMMQAEWDYWSDPSTLDKTPEDRKTFVVGAQRRLPLIKEKLELFSPGAEVIPGVEAIGTPGHTPGHASFMIHGEGNSPLLITGDVLSSPVSFTHPNWHWGTDHDPKESVVTRNKLLDRATHEKARLIGYHLPHPGEGVAVADGTAYRFRSSEG
ncbi:MBL fold metallo-hydrolase [Hyphomicrobium methylovorum]|uniref:MBL fold metallo-hydrolase n=1 Tax=Hyphomicrobium methylovorum TaxID=84 RepID=UPI0031B5FC5B